MDKIYFSKVKSNAIIPSKRGEDGCYDIYACLEEDGYIVINPDTIYLVPTGIASSCSSKYRFELRERGSSGTKGLSRRAGQIDSGYRNEWFFPINNTVDKPIVIIRENDINKWVQDHRVYESDYIFYPYEKAIGQIALEFVPEVEVQEIPYDELLNIKSERGLGKLGSSDK